MFISRFTRTACTLATALLLTALPPQAKADKPNILFIMSDDHTTQAIGAYGGMLAQFDPTPTLDQIAAEGMRFTAALCSNSICTPSRATIMTGQYGHINGVPTLNDPLLIERQYLAQEMNAAGYDTAVIGKWHLKNRPETFDHYQVLPSQGLYFDPEFFICGQEEPVVVEGHSTDVITDLALAWLDGEERNADKPFFLKLQYKAPHDYFENAPRYNDYLADVVIPEPASMFDDPCHGSVATRGVDGELHGVIGTSIGRRHYRRSYAKDFIAPKLPHDANEWQPEIGPTDLEAKRAAYQIYLKRYLRCVKGVDDNIARVVAYLKDNDLYDNTVIIYTGDQGMWLGEHDYQDKRWAYEESLRMPLLIRYPKSIPAGTVSDALIENVDFAPTMLDFAGVETPEYMQGKSFRSILETGETPEGWRDAAFYQYWMHMIHHQVPGHLAMRTDRFKLIFFHGRPLVDRYMPWWAEVAKHPTPPGWELYDLDVDPGENNNVYEDPAYADDVKRLKERFAELIAEVKADDPSAAGSDFVKLQMDALLPYLEKYWDDTPENKAEAARISRELHEFIYGEKAAE
ncbi:sulfatase family protein [Algisphaera agarilytica]|uniref:Arylsulfatase A-like enzyme n=1 Tax=Algisphaera agarilytica TaxID=1385975 RepID=A0A7X0LJ00_9BACT|nr:sulfatase [Algisphaera agarilytica]MBB6428775.1 arylsulfatase A-like enzyme [Algisphaera agarilytica]